MIVLVRTLTSIALVIIYTMAVVAGLDQSNVGHAAAIIMLIGTIALVWWVPDPPPRRG